MTPLKERGVRVHHSRDWEVHTGLGEVISGVTRNGIMVIWVSHGIHLRGLRQNDGMASKGKPSPRSAVSPLSDHQVDILAQRHHLVDPTRYYPTGHRLPALDEIDGQHPTGTTRLLRGVSDVVRDSCKVYAWGLERVPQTGPFITAATHVTQFDVFIPMMALFHQGRRPRFMAKAEMGGWPLIGNWFRMVGMQPVERKSGRARSIEEESIAILVSGRPLTIWPEGTVTRDPLKWPMSLKPGVGFIALEASRQLGSMVPLYPSITWGAASINHKWPWPRKNVVMCYDQLFDYSDLLRDMDQWGLEPPKEAVHTLCVRLRNRMEEVMAEIRGEEPPAQGYFDYVTMTRRPRSEQ